MRLCTFDMPGRILKGLCLAAVAFAAQAAESKPGEPPKGLALHFTFDQQPADDAVADQSGQNNHGRAVGAKWNSAGKKGGGCELASAVDHVRVQVNPALGGKQFTVSFWLKTTKADGVWRQILGRQPGNGFRLGICGDAKDVNIRGRVVFVVGNSPVCLSDSIVTDGQWHHVAASYDGELLRLYVDTQSQRQVEFRGEIPVATDLIIGLDRLPAAKPDAPPAERRQAFEGILDELAVYSRPLAAEEIRSVALAVDPNATRPRFTRSQVMGRLRQLKQLYEEELITEEFYERKVKECEALQ